MPNYVTISPGLDANRAVFPAVSKRCAARLSSLSLPGIVANSTATPTRLILLTSKISYILDLPHSLTAQYLAAVWQTPCYDCWEERGSDVHISTLAAIYAGLGVAHALIPTLDFSDTQVDIQAFIMARGITPSGELGV